MEKSLVAEAAKFSTSATQMLRGTSPLRDCNSAQPNTLTRQAISMDKPTLLDQVRQVMPVRHHSLRTEEAYARWIKESPFFHHKRHLEEMGKDAVSRFLPHLAVTRNVTAATQHQARSALLFTVQFSIRRSNCNARSRCCDYPDSISPYPYSRKSRSGCMADS